MKRVELVVTYTETTVTTTKIHTDVPDCATDAEVLAHCQDGDYWWERHEDSGDVGEFVVEHRQLLNIEVVNDDDKET